MREWRGRRLQVLIARPVAWLRFGVIGLAWIGGAWIPAAETDSPAGAPADDSFVRAYDRPLPRPVEFHNVALTALDDETGRPLADVEVRINNGIDWRNHAFRTDARGRLRYEYPSRPGDPVVSIELRKEG